MPKGIPNNTKEHQAIKDARQRIIIRIDKLAKKAEEKPYTLSNMLRHNTRQARSQWKIRLFNDHILPISMLRLEALWNAYGLTRTKCRDNGDTTGKLSLLELEVTRDPSAFNEIFRYESLATRSMFKRLILREKRLAPCHLKIEKLFKTYRIA